MSMNKRLALLLAGTMALSLTGCGGSGDTDSAKEPEAPKNLALGETAATDLAEFTLNRADLAVALENTVGDTYFVPKEYSAEQDAQNPYVASKGHCLVAMSYTLKNLDRGSLDLDNSFSGGAMFSVSYGGENYEGVETTYGAQKKAGGDWTQYQSSNVLLMAGDCNTYRCYVDIPVEVANLEDDFTVSVRLPNAEGEHQHFTYGVTAADRKAAAEKELADAEAERQAAWQAEALELAPVSDELAAQIVAQLDGEWQYSDNAVSYTLTFDQGYCRVDSSINGTPALSNEGSYSIREKAVLIQYDNGNAAKINYTFDDNVLDLKIPLTGVDSEVLDLL